MPLPVSSLNLKQSRCLARLPAIVSPAPPEMLATGAAAFGSDPNAGGTSLLYDLGGFIGTYDQGAVDGQGHIFAANNNGNLTSSSGGFYTYTYDAENRLINWTFVYENTAQTDFVYDGLGRLRKRVEYT